MYKWTKHSTKLKFFFFSIFLNFLINKPEVITRWSLARNRIRNAPIYYPENVENKWKIIFETWCEFSQIKIQNIVKHDAQYFHFFPFFFFFFFLSQFSQEPTEDNQKTENQSQRSVILLINHPMELNISASCQFLVIFSSSFLFFCFLFFPQFSKQTKRG